MSDKDLQALLRQIPSVDEILTSMDCSGILETVSRDNLVKLVRLSLDEIRNDIRDGKPDHVDRLEILSRISRHLQTFLGKGQKAVINATGIIIHTNMGRSLLSQQTIQALINVSTQYSNLEFDFGKGIRGHRNQNVDWLLTFLTGAEDAFVVNNNAAAVLICLNTVARGKEAIISRGELIEIGGGFRIPEVMSSSGCILKEVGTTNKTRLTDYRNAVSEKTGLILKVHSSNYRIVGFVEETPLEEVVSLGKQFSIPVLHDLGSGKLFETLSQEPVPEPTVEKSVRAGVDLITFSADKLLGGPQAGIILGDRVIMKNIRENPLARAVRLDKLILGALEATLRHYMNPEKACMEIPTLAMMHMSVEQVQHRVELLFKYIEPDVRKELGLKTERGYSQVGGGSLPMWDIPTVLIGFHHSKFTPDKIADFFRKQDPPVIGRIQKETFYMDLRTVNQDQLEYLGSVIQSLHELIAQM